MISTICQYSKKLNKIFFRNFKACIKISLFLFWKKSMYGLDHRDFNRFENREMQECIMGTMFGSIKINRRKYVDRETGDRVALLDQYLQFNGSDTLSPFLTEMVVKWAVKGPSYRDARDRFYDLLGYQAMSHEKIRQEVLKIEPKSVEDKTKHPKDVDALFLEVDG